MSEPNGDSGAVTVASEGGDFIDGEWWELETGQDLPLLESRNPAHPSEVVWSGRPRLWHVGPAVQAARKALPGWVKWGRERRFAVLRRFAEICTQQEPAMARRIRDEIGKAMWEAKGEASILGGKVEITLDESDTSGGVGGVGGGGLRRVSDYELVLGPTRAGRCLWRPHGAMAVIGPFNFPAHLPIGHIVPALAMGNTIVFKPSDKAPGVGDALMRMLAMALEEEGAPGKGAGVVNLLQGGAETASALVSHPGIDGILFTGSWPVGRKILEANLDNPGRIVALELGGNSAAVVMPDADLRQAAIEIVRCAFNTTGQRCTCTRRAIIHRAVGDKMIGAICKAASNLIVGDPRATHPVFMGPLISAQTREAVLRFQEEATRRGGGEVLLQASALSGGEYGDGYFITPSVIRVERFRADEEGGAARDAGCDVEVFGPLLRICVVDSLDEAIEQANATRYGLAASIFTRDAAAIERFLLEARAGCINVNCGTAGASSKLPFGGLGHSGNHRPAGSLSLDYCAYPVAGMIESGGAATVAEGMRFEDTWL